MSHEPTARISSSPAAAAASMSTNRCSDEFTSLSGTATTTESPVGLSVPTTIPLHWVDPETEPVEKRCSPGPDGRSVGNFGCVDRFDSWTRLTTVPEASRNSP